MKTRIRLAFLLVAGQMALAASASAGEADARQIFLSKCALCHGKTGVPNAGFAKKGVRDFTQAEWQESRSDQDLAKAIREGRKGTMMAAFGDAFTAAEVDALVHFIRSLKHGQDRAVGMLVRPAADAQGVSA